MRKTRIAKILSLLSITVALSFSSVCRAEPPLFADEVGEYAWGTSFEEFAAREDMRCLPADNWCMASIPEVLLDVEVIKLRFWFDEQGLCMVALEMTEDNYARFAETVLKPVVGVLEDRKETRIGTAGDGVVLNVSDSFIGDERRQSLSIRRVRSKIK